MREIFLIIIITASIASEKTVVDDTVEDEAMELPDDDAANSLIRPLKRQPVVQRFKGHKGNTTRSKTPLSPTGNDTVANITRISLNENARPPKVYIKKYAEDIQAWFAVTLKTYLKEMHKIYADEIERLYEKLVETSLKDLDSINWIRNSLERMTEEVIHIVKQMQNVLDEEHEYLKNQTSQIRDTFNSFQFQLYVMVHDWNFYGFGKYFAADKMKQIFPIAQKD